MGYFYEMQASGIGTYFLESLYRDIDALSDNAGIHPLHFGGYHRLLASRFPFAIYFKVIPDTALIYAVLDCRREPAWIRPNLGGNI
jgi:hypothetical protein